VAFERAYDDAVQALLAKDYEAAYRHFLEAQYHEPDDRRVRANLERLLALGAHGGTP
jgi:Flp pilus assembly protein TadD